MKRYSIFVREYGSDRDVELMQVENNPGPVVEGLKKKKLTIRASIFEPGKRVFKVPKYTTIDVRENFQR